MNQVEVIGSVKFSMSCGLKPWQKDPDEYWQSVEGKVIASVDKEEDPDAIETAGDLQLVVIKMAEAVNDHVSLHQVFDAHSIDLEELYHALFDEDEGFKKDLQIECGPSDILYVDSVKLRPKYKSSLLFFQALESAIAMFASQGLIVAHMSTLNLGDNEWTRCGFEVVPGTAIVFRDNVRLDPRRKID